VNNKKIGIIITIFIFIILLSGCIDENNSENDDTTEADLHNEFLGVWTGHMNYSKNMGFSIHNFPEDSNFTEMENMTNMTNMQNFSHAYITQLEFSKDIVEMTITTGNDTLKTMTLSNSYTVEDNQLILSMDFSGWRPEGMEPPEDGEFPNGDPGGREPPL